MQSLVRKLIRENKTELMRVEVGPRADFDILKACQLDGVKPHPGESLDGSLATHPDIVCPSSVDFFDVELGVEVAGFVDRSQRVVENRVNAQLTRRGDEADELACVGQLGEGVVGLVELMNAGQDEVGVVF